MDWLKHCTSQRNRLQGWLLWVLDSRLCLPPCVVFLLRLGASRLKPCQISQQQTAIFRERSRGFPELCPNYEMTSARRSRYTYLRVSSFRVTHWWNPRAGSHKLELEHRAVSETNPLARHCLRVDDGARVGKPVVDMVAWNCSSPGPAFNCTQLPDHNTKNRQRVYNSPALVPTLLAFADKQCVYRNM